MKTAIVTGAASGIGRGYALALVEKGFYVLVTDIDELGAEHVAAELNAMGPGKAEALRVDVTDVDAVAAAVHRVKDEHGRLDMIFNNAGMGVVGPVEELTIGHWRKATEVMIMGVVHGVQPAYKIMVEQGYGHIVNTASSAGLIPLAFMGPYDMAKHAVVGLTVSLRAEAAAHGIKVTCVCPGPVNTNIVRNVKAAIGETTEADIAVTGYDKVQPYLHLVPEFLVASPEVHGRKVLQAALRDQAFVLLPGYMRPLWWLQRLAPTVPVAIGVVLSRVAKAARPHIAERWEQRGAGDRQPVG
ncbi:SDR family NAD(P)-dependent oxidoreductase [Nocardia altamirensis]|uniref:SDR family NAD(P)-dependent oxidoreductase n=1 Tax=Nocardia altamirensis TaxID=472158 RepID=UPI0014355249|nr:SDR family oxidoreductase [Nocardia altamirensis]